MKGTKPRIGRNKTKERQWKESKTGEMPERESKMERNKDRYNDGEDKLKE